MEELNFLSPYVLHRHRCGACGLPDSSSMTFETRDDCECPWPEIDAICVSRVPGARNPKCPSLANYGKDDITALMRAEYEKERQRLPLHAVFDAFHFGLGIDPQGRILPLSHWEEVWKQDYWTH
jgi:hypothetical protein